MTNPYKFRHSSQSVIMANYGVLVDSVDHRFVKNVETLMSAVSQTLRPGAMLIDVLPICKFISSRLLKAFSCNSMLLVKKVPGWVPGAYYQRAKKEWTMYTQKLMNDPFQASREMIVSKSTSNVLHMLNYFAYRMMENLRSHPTSEIFSMHKHTRTRSTETRRD